MKIENVKSNIKNAYIRTGLYHWLGNKYFALPTLPMDGGDLAKQKFLENNIKIVNFKDYKKFRCYVIVTSWVGDPVIEFKVKLTKLQEAYLKKELWTKLSETINDEESRWVSWGTSIDPLSKLSWIGGWSDNAEKLAKRVLLKKRLKCKKSIK